MERLHPDSLRTLYQESASMFLLSCHKMNSADETHTATCTLNQEKEQQVPKNKHKKRKNNKVEFDPIEIARSLMLRSLYDKDILSASKPNFPVCVDSNSGGRRSTAETNFSRSGAFIDILPVSSPTLPSLSKAFISKGDANRQEPSIPTSGKELSDGDISVTKNTLSSIRKAAESASKVMAMGGLGNWSTVRSDFYCKACGLAYFSPLSKPTGEYKKDNGLGSKIRLRTLKRGRTRRRRASRYLAKKYVFDYEILQKHRGGGRKFSSTVITTTPMNTITSGTGVAATASTTAASHGSSVASVMETLLALRRRQLLRRTRDGIAKHCITYQCSCGSSQSFKGFRPRRNANNNYNKTGCGTDAPFVTRSGTSALNKKRRQDNGQERIDNGPDDGVNDNFLAFKSGTTGSSGGGKDVNLLVSSGRRRNKSKTLKKGKQGKSKLNDFLSSLND